MLTNKQVYHAFMACKRIYGSDEIHVQLLAAQLGVLASEVIKYIELSGIVTTRVLVEGSGINYSGTVISGVEELSFMVAENQINEGDVDPSVELSFTGATFDGSDDVEEWQVNTGTTGLTFDSVSGTILMFTGTATAGTIEIKPLSEFVTDGLDVDTIYLTIDAKEYDYANVKAGLSV